MSPSEVRDKSDEELQTLEGELRDQLMKLRIAQATQRSRNTSQFGRIRRDIARVKTILGQRRAKSAGGVSKGEEVPG